MKTKILILLAFITLILVFITRPYCNFLNKTLHISFLKTLFSHDSLKSYDNQVNIALLGIAGGQNEGPDLSDSIIVVSYHMKTNQASTIAIPRDIWSSTLKDRINSAYAYGEATKNGGGLKLAKAELSSIVGIPIHYAAVINFDEFQRLIDFLGGIQVNIERSFTDNEYPIAGKENDTCNGDKEYRCRYKTVNFKAGVQQMDGKTALIFTRSRHGQGVEAGDFARTKRQQKIIEAIKDKLLGNLNLLDMEKLKNLYLVTDKLILRDLTNQQAAILVKNIVLKRNFKQNEIILDENFFTVPDYWLYDGKYVLVPKTGDFDLIHQYINCKIKNSQSCSNLEKKSKENQ